MRNSAVLHRLARCRSATVLTESRTVGGRPSLGHPLLAESGLGCTKGSYKQSVRHTLSVRLSLSPEQAKRLDRAEVNGMRVRPHANQGTIELRGEGGAGSAFRWSLVRG